MKTRLLRKIRKRIISLDYSQDGVYITYLNKDCKIAGDNTCLNRKGFLGRGVLNYVIYGMFGEDSLFVRILMFMHERTIKNRNASRVKKKRLEYKF